MPVNRFCLAVGVLVAFATGCTAVSAPVPAPEVTCIDVPDAECQRAAEVALAAMTPPHPRVVGVSIVASQTTTCPNLEVERYVYDAVIEYEAAPERYDAVAIGLDANDNLRACMDPGAPSR